MIRMFSLGLGLLIGLAALLPVRWLLPVPPLAATAVEGTVWSARLTNAALGGARLGDVALRLSPAALLRGRLQWQASGGLDGSLWQSLAGGGGDGLTGQLRGLAMAGVPVAGIDLMGVSAAFDGRGRCLNASGQVQLMMGTALAGQTSLSGAARCDGTVLAMPLASSDGRVRLDVGLAAAGWTARLVVTGAAAGEAAALANAGFRAEAGALVRQEQGLW